MSNTARSSPREALWRTALCGALALASCTLTQELDELEGNAGAGASAGGSAGVGGAQTGGGAGVDAGGGAACPAGFADCDGEPSTGCEVALQADPLHCGACGNVCPPGTGTTVCKAGICGSSPCSAPFASCDDNPVTCETDVQSSTDHCGFCNHACSLPHATPKCAGGECEIALCDPGFADCDGKAATGCEVDLQSDMSHCGACAKPCALTGATSACTAGACKLVACAPDRGDCDGVEATGCEKDLGADPKSCGVCGKTCSAEGGFEAICTAGVCGTSGCGKGLGDCDGNPADCETELQKSVQHCGFCGNACSLPNATPKCQSGSCAVDACSAGFLDCNGQVADGCEVQSGTDPNNCGVCGAKCSAQTPAHMVSTGCALDKCQYQCAPGWTDCNALVTDGCEVDLGTSGANCGQCGRSCLGQTCTGGICTPALLASGETGANAIALGPSDVYFTRDSYVRRVSKSGGTAATTEAGPTAIALAVDASYAFFDNTAGTRVRRDTLANNVSNSVLFSPAITKFGDLALDATTVYWTDTGAGKVLKQAKTNGSSIEVVGVQAQPTAITVDSAYVFWVNTGANLIMSYNLGTSSLSAVASGLLAPQKLASDGTFLYWTGGGASGGVYRKKRDGTGTIETIATGQSQAYALCVDGTSVYWTTNEANGAVRKAPKAPGGTVQALAIGQNLPRSIAVDATRVYWTAYGAGTVATTPK